MLPCYLKGEAVVEILETIEPDVEVLGACRRLKDLGYTIALDDFVDAEKFQPFIDDGLGIPSHCANALDCLAV